MGDMGEVFNAWRERRREERQKNLLAADPTGWTRHDLYHWSRMLCGHRLDYWPSKRKWRWKNKNHVGDVTLFIKNREAEQEKSR